MFGTSIRELIKLRYSSSFDFLLSHFLSLLDPGVLGTRAGGSSDAMLADFLTPSTGSGAMSPLEDSSFLDIKELSEVRACALINCDAALKTKE